MKYYTGVGSRNTPRDILQLMGDIAHKLAVRNFILRSGGAKGADKAFEYGAGPLAVKHIYYADQANDAAMAIAKQFHPAWNRCNDYARKLHGRNAFQVLGDNLNEPSNFLICWTSDGCISHSTRTIKTSGTGTAISIAEAYNIPIFNLQREDHLSRLLTLSLESN